MRDRSDHTPRTRDAALRRLGSANRWLVAGSAAITGIFTAIAANAFPGHTVKSGTAAARNARSEAATKRHARTLSSPASTPESDYGAEEGFESSEADAGEEELEAPSEEIEGSEEGYESSAQESVEEARLEAESEVEAEPEAPIVSGGS